MMRALGLDFTATARLVLPAPDLPGYFTGAVEAMQEWAVMEDCEDCPACLTIRFAVAAEDLAEARAGAVGWLARETGVRVADLVVVQA